MDEYQALGLSASDPLVKAQATWVAELQAAHKEFEEFHERGNKILDIYGETKKVRRQRKFPLFNANVDILQNALFARIPRPDVSRRFKDPDDQVGRVAALILQRALVTEIEGNSEFKVAAKSMIKDLLVPGMGVGWVRYVADVEYPAQLTEDTDEELAEFADASPIIKDQQTPIDYVHWKDVRWSPCRTWNECRWVGRAVYINKEEAEERFGDAAKWMSFSEKTEDRKSANDAGVQNNTEPQAKVWEIWDKTTKKVYFICEDCPVALDIKEDFLGLPDFFPTDRPLFANSTTSTTIPVADFTLLQDQYNELNEVNSRISRLIRACRLAGVYDETQAAVKLLLDGAEETKLVPVKNFVGFAEKGGLKGAIDMMDISTTAQVIAQLTQHREAIKQQIYELTGISDIVRGASNPYETAAAQGMKAQYASIRLQGKQSEVAEYLSSLISKKAYLMLKFYEPQRLLQRCGTLTQADQQYVPAAIELLQNELMLSLKLEVSTDALQQPNWAREQQERSQTIGAISNLLSQAIPAAQQIPQLAPLFLHIIKWGVAGNPGSRDLEGVIEMGLQQVMNSQGKGEEKPDPAAQAAQAKLQMEQAKFQADMQMQQQKMQAEQAAAQAKLQLERERMVAELQLERERMLAELQLKREAEMAKVSQKQVPQVIAGNNGLDADELGVLLQQMQEQTVEAIMAASKNTTDIITALATREQEPTQIKVSKNAAGEFVGTIE